MNVCKKMTLVTAILFCVVRSEAVTLTNERSHITIPSPLAAIYPSGFSSSHSSDTTVDRAGNLHIIKTYDAGHLGDIQYRRWDYATTNWGGAVVTLGSGGGTWDARYAQMAIDDADRIHVLYQHRIGTDDWTARAVALVWAVGNRDNKLVPNQNYTRVRDPETGWGDREVAFTNDARGMPGSTGGPYVSFAGDGAGGLFCGYSKATISHWDLETRDWQDVFTNVVASADTVSSLGTYYRDHKHPAYVYYYKKSNQSLYVGTYYLRPPPPTGTIVIMR